MANKKISQLTPGTALVGTEPIPTVQGGVTVSTTPNAIGDLIKPYKVFTALLTQSGGNGNDSVVGDQTINVGVTYIIDYLAPGDNLIPYGAPNNDQNTSFICNQNVSNWGSGTSQLSFNTGAPVATVLENTIGNVWFTYNSADLYFINGFEKFTIGKFWAVSGPVLGDTMFLPTEINNVNPNYASISYVKDGVTQNGYLNRTPIEIRVYN